MSTKVRERTKGGVGESVHRVDGVPKVKGQFLYGSDLWAEEMLWGYTVRSPHAHARIRSVDVSAALVYPGVHAALVAADVPGKKVYGLEIPDQPVLAWDRVRYQGEPVAILAAIDLETARRAADRVRVVYEVLPAVTDMEQALRPDAPQVHDHGNVVKHVHIEHGNPEAGADVWVEGYYETGMQDQAILGPESGLAVPAEDGGVDLYVATQ
ncbi:MAG: xanthine dehydrogenase subunit D, partial [Armatimonadota bacterium]|nr:xanthine dehydrogenase subunit D [Armatimonadota bacterium]